MKTFKLIALTIILFATSFANAQKHNNTQTERVYLSGRGADDMVQWDFFCTDGANAGKWSKIGVPSCWELQGFGTYQYGMRWYGRAFPDGVANEKGMYKHEFEVPASWNGKQIFIVFEASMTDTEVKINGQRAGEMHQGAFNRFSYNISHRLKYGKKNLLEVTVSKESANAGVNLAERRADYWNFGGIFRPVFLEVKPAIHMQQIGIDAKANGQFAAHLQLNRSLHGAKVNTKIIDNKGKVIAENQTSIRPSSDNAIIEISVDKPAMWSAETPNRHTAHFTLLSADGKELHSIQQKFGFRTIEVRESDGLYINGVRVNIRGVNRHSFRPETGRTLSKAKNIADVVLIKSMNMNAVRLAHYPADPEFLEACDSLGLYLMNELSGWHGKHDTPNGKKLIKSLVERDVNHPSVIWWANGNEGGWNTELDGEFHKYDPQKRPVLHPQGNFGGFETMHYRSYGESQEYMRKPEIFMPTEFLHGLYDGGHGAGLYDYWEMMRKHPRCAGGFLWVLADEGVKRVDMDGFIDNQGNWGADGIVGPNHEKEGSYYTIKELWNPVQIMTDKSDAAKGMFFIENRYDFLNVNTCNFEWSLVQFPDASDAAKQAKTLQKGSVQGPNIAAHSSGELKLNLPSNKDADALILRATDYRGHELWRWTFRLKNTEKFVNKASQTTPQMSETAETLTVKAGAHTFAFSKKDGELKMVNIANKTISLSNGPRFVAARRADRSLDQFYNHDDEHSRAKERTYTEFADKAVFVGFETKTQEGAFIIEAKYKLGNLDKVKWTIYPDATVAVDYQFNFHAVVDLMGVKFDYPEEKVLSKRWLGKGPYRVWQNRLHGPVYDIWENDYNDPIPGESFTYPEFKGYFAEVDWMQLRTQEGQIYIKNETPNTYIGVFQPRDGRDVLLYTLPQTGISVLNVIPAVRNKVNTTDLNGPSAQPKWVSGNYEGRVVLKFEN